MTLARAAIDNILMDCNEKPFVRDKTERIHSTGAEGRPDSCCNCTRAGNTATNEGGETRYAVVNCSVWVSCGAEQQFLGGCPAIFLHDPIGNGRGERREQYTIYRRRGGKLPARAMVAVSTRARTITLRHRRKIWVAIRGFFGRWSWRCGHGLLEVCA